jgi:hypothetical protein
MKLDIRYPIGLLFLIVGAILAACGLSLHPEPHAGPATEPNIDLSWGLIQIVFGAVMLGLAMRASRKAPGPP